MRRGLEGGMWAPEHPFVYLRFYRESWMSSGVVSLLVWGKELFNSVSISIGTRLLETTFIWVRVSRRL